jgi:hypothetical protein
VNILRGTAYVTTTIASVLFVVVVVFGYIQLNAAVASLRNVFPSSSTSSPSFGEPAPAPGSSGEEMYCFYNPEDPTCSP